MNIEECGIKESSKNPNTNDFYISNLDTKNNQDEIDKNILRSSKR